MTSNEAIEARPRRKWGWIFVAIFLIELAVSGSLVWSKKAEIARLNTYFVNKDIIYLTYVKIQKLEEEVRQVYVWSAILLPATLALAAFGLRRRVASAEPPPAAADAS